MQIGMDKEPICIHGNVMLTVPGNISKICNAQSYIVEQAAHHKSQHGLVVNSCCVMSKARRVPVILININDQNIRVRQPLLATELFEVEVEPQCYHTEINQEGGEMVISFLSAPQCEDQEQVENNAVEVDENLHLLKEDTLPEEYPKFRERTDTGKAIIFRRGRVVTISI